MRNIFAIAIYVSFFISAAADISGHWQLIATFDEGIEKVIETPSTVYLQALAQPFVPGVVGYADKASFIYAYDKESNEMRVLSGQNRLSGTNASYMAYNPDREYLLVGYSDGRIDLLFDNGKNISIDALQRSTLQYSKSINDVTFLPDKNLVLVALPFGYVIIDDDKGEITDSRNYGENIVSAGIVDGDLILITSSGARIAPVSSPRLSIADYAPLSIKADASSILPLDRDRFMYISPSGVRLASKSDPEGEIISQDPSRYIIALKGGGGIACGYWNMVRVNKDGEYMIVELPEDDRGRAVACRDMKTFWIGVPRKGLCSKSSDNNGGWTVTTVPVRPDAPAAFISQSFTTHPRYGMLVSQHGINRVFQGNGVKMPMLLSGYKDGKWTQYDPFYTNESLGGIVRAAAGIAIDPDDDKYIYTGSYYSGFARFNLEDPTDVLHLASRADPFASKPGFHAVVPPQGWDEYCNFSAPSLDPQGNLWMLYDSEPVNAYEGVWVWPSDARKNSDVAGLAHFNIENYDGAMTHNLTALHHKNNKNLIAITPGSYQGPIHILDYGGTPSDPDDDKCVMMTTIYDRQGSQVEKDFIYTMVEDPATGALWVGCTQGVFYFYPSKAMQDPDYVERPIIERGDGTDLADYLLSGVPVYSIAIDGAGRKWFATGGGGLVCTNSEGTKILHQFTSEDSELPSDQVYGVGFDQLSGHLYVSTSAGMARFIPADTDGSVKKDELHIYPNPVRPDYYGLVTISGLEEGWIVKILDSSGHLVKESDPADFNSVEWDLTGINGKRVGSGVYFVVASAPASGSGSKKTGRIVVIN